ncbi:hypothetical protein CAEBREN_08964 [Caenorhabditis brenneri]|uniref:Uncharacterized protein n=1 Tax=Caenorhabditis brenneri TaxID=135651 RepID=G0PFU6_CAEBE|nr:hypothetical protein CAEBREN_08964 [Caenorhabditis brenneri]
MKLIPILFLALLIASDPVLARGIRCTTTKQCAYMSVCDGGYCLTMEEMFEKYGFDDGQGSHGRHRRQVEFNYPNAGQEEVLEESRSQDDQKEPHPRVKRSSQPKYAFDGGY